VAVVVAGARELTGAAATDVDEATAWVDCEVAEAAVVAKEAEVEAAVGLMEAEVVDAEAGAVPFLPQSVKVNVLESMAVTCTMPLLVLRVVRMLPLMSARPMPIRYGPLSAVSPKGVTLR
jgi:hypothetical protein